MDAKHVQVNGRMTGSPCDVKVSDLHGICDQETGRVPIGMMVRLDSPEVPAWWMEVRLSKEIIEGMYDWLHGGIAELPEVK